MAVRKGHLRWEDTRAGSPAGAMSAGQATTPDAVGPPAGAGVRLRRPATDVAPLTPPVRPVTPEGQRG